MGIAIYTVHRLQNIDIENWVIIWIIFLVPIQLLYFGARKKKKRCLIPFMIVVGFLLAIFFSFSILCLVGFVLLTWHWISGECYKCKEFIYIAVAFCPAALVVAVTFALLWILRTINAFYVLLEVDTSIGLSYIHSDLDRERQNSIVPMADEIARLDIDTDGQQDGENELGLNANLPTITLTNQCQEEEDHCETQNDSPPGYSEAVQIGRCSCTEPPPSYRDAIKKERKIFVL